MNTPKPEPVRRAGERCKHDLSTCVVCGPPVAEPVSEKVGCSRSDGTLNIHPAAEFCDVCRVAEPVSDPKLAEAVEWAEEEISVCQFQDDCDREYANRLRALLSGLERLKAELAEAKEGRVLASRDWLEAKASVDRLEGDVEFWTKKAGKAEAELAKLREHQDAAIALLEQRDREQKAELAEADTRANKTITHWHDRAVKAESELAAAREDVARLVEEKEQHRRNWRDAEGRVAEARGWKP